MTFLIEKLVRFLKSPFKLGHSWSPLRGFRSKTFGSLSQAGGEEGSEMTPVALLYNCLMLMHAANAAFAELLVEIDYPMSQWGAVAVNDYLRYTLTLMEMLNSINFSVNHLSSLMMTALNGSSLDEKSPNSAAEYYNKIWTNNLASGFNVEMSPGINLKPVSEQKERVILEALMVMKKIGCFALSLVASGLSSDVKPFLDMGSDDPLKKAIMESRFWRDMEKIQGFVEEVNRENEEVSAAISSGKSDEDVEELTEKLLVMKNAIREIKVEADRLFSGVVVGRKKVLEHLRV